MKIFRKIPFKTKRGTFVLEMSPKGLYSVRFPRKVTLNPQHTPGVCLGSNAHRVREAVDWFKNYFNHCSRRFSGRFDLSGYTLFQKKVYRTLQKVPAGKVITYEALAKRAGYPGAARAVGSAMRKNRLPIVIPCHRVILASGELGEYSPGKMWKRWLLVCENQGRGQSPLPLMKRKKSGDSYFSGQK